MVLLSKWPTFQRRLCQGTLPTQLENRLQRQHHLEYVWARLLDEIVASVFNPGLVVSHKTKLCFKAVWDVKSWFAYFENREACCSPTLQSQCTRTRPTAFIVSLKRMGMGRRRSITHRFFFLCCFVLKQWNFKEVKSKNVVSHNYRSANYFLLFFVCFFQRAPFFFFYVTFDAYGGVTAILLSDWGQILEYEERQVSFILLRLLPIMKLFITHL